MPLIEEWIEFEQSQVKQLTQKVIELQIENEQLKQKLKYAS